MNERQKEDKITLHTMDDWHAFVRENHDVIIDAYGSIDDAYLQATAIGGLIFGGGATPIIIVMFQA